MKRNQAISLVGMLVGVMLVTVNPDNITARVFGAGFFLLNSLLFVVQAPN
jgi:hypothetical protein